MERQRLWISAIFLSVVGDEFETLVFEPAILSSSMSSTAGVRARVTADGETASLTASPLLDA